MQSNNSNIYLSGVGLSPGLAMGEVYRYQDILEQDVKIPEIDPGDTDREHQRLCSALEQVQQELSDAEKQVHKAVGPSVAEIFRAHQQILDDPTLAEELRDEVSHNLVPAERAVRRVSDRWEQRLQEMESETFQTRDADIADLARRILKVLLDIEAHTLENMPPGSILVAKRLYPSDAVFFSVSSPAALVVEVGSPGSHCALLTRELGIPGVAQVPDIWDKLSGQDVVLVDGIHGNVIVSPDEETKARFQERQDEYEATLKKAKSRSAEPAITKTGTRVPVMANIGNRHDARVAAENGADGAGLYRTEVLFARRQSFPTENELVNEMSEVLAPLHQKRCVVRLMDIGGDKELSFLESFSETNPFLGRRGIRLLLSYPRLLRVQLRAMLQLSRDFQIQIMVPMVTVADDMRQVREMLDEVANEVGISDLPPLVALIETPAAALCASKIARYADSLSVGTNDLTQYTMAAGRDNPLVVHYFQDDHPSVLRLIRMVCREADDTPVFVCGGLAGRLNMAETLIKAGVSMLSVAPPLIPSVKQAVREIE